MTSTAPDPPLTWSEAELLATHEIAEPLVLGGVRCHGGYTSDGTYVSPRTKHRVPAIRAWQQAHVSAFGGEVLEAPISMWPEPYPNVAQSKYLLREGVRTPVVTSLTRIGTVEGFGAMIRHVDLGDLQRYFVEPIEGTALQHLQRGLFEAHARDEAGWGGEAGHDRMWFAARDIAFEHPVTEDETATMLARMGIPDPSAPRPDPEEARRAAEAARLVADVDLVLEMTLRRMLGLMFIEVSAFHTFAWAEAVLDDRELVAGDGAAAEIVRCIRTDETPHVDYLRTALTEVRDRTIIGESGRKIPGADVIGALWDAAVHQSLRVNRPALLRTTLAEVERALEGERRRDEILEGFHACGTVRPSATGELEPVAGA
jgi:hypothetical protein